MANRALGEFGHVEAEAEEVDVDNRGEERVLEFRISVSFDKDWTDPDRCREPFVDLLCFDCAR
jgi:hypothetical protein